MSKELEAFYKILERSEFAYIGHKDVDIVVKAITPPTANEVCMKLSKHYNEQVLYSNERHNQMFYFEKSKLGIIRLRDGNTVFVQGEYHKTNNLPPDIITLIGRFYEGLEVK